jgi:hypothetical protein
LTISKDHREISGDVRGDFGERANHDYREIFVQDLDYGCAGGGESFVAVHAVCGGGGIADVGAAEEPGMRTILDLDGGFSEISDSIFFVGWRWELSWMVARD